MVLLIIHFIEFSHKHHHNLYKIVSEQSIGPGGRINGPILAVYTTLINILTLGIAGTIRLYNLRVGPLVDWW